MTHHPSLDHSNLTDSCIYQVEPENNAEFYLVAVFGTVVSVVSILENAPLFYIFLCRSSFRLSHYFYMMFLAFFDVFIAISYIMLMSVQVLFDYLLSFELSQVWHFCMRPIFAITRISMAASTYLVVAATLERFLVANRLLSFAFQQKHRCFAVFLSIFTAMVFQGTVFAEFNVMEKENCTNLARFYLAHTELMNNEIYRTVFAFWLRNVFSIILPFILLASMNFSILHRLSKDQKGKAHIWRHRFWPSWRTALTDTVRVASAHTGSNWEPCSLTWPLCSPKPMTSLRVPSPKLMQTPQFKLQLLCEGNVLAPGTVKGSKTTFSLLE